MARYHVSGSKFDSTTETFSTQDKELMKGFDSFKGFTICGISISNIFPEYVDAGFDNTNYTIPCTIQQDEQQMQVWPIEKSFISSEK